MRRYRSFSRRFRQKLFLSFVITCSVMLGVAFEIFYREASNLILEQSGNDTGYQLEQTEAFIENLESETMRILQMLMLDYGQSRLLNGLSGEEADKVMVARTLFEQIRNVLDNYTYIDSIFYYGYDGMVLGAGNNFQRYVQNVKSEGELPCSWIYPTPIYQKLLSGKNQYTWIGGTGKKNFSFYKNEEDGNYLTFLARLNVQFSHPVVVVINIKENYLSGLYDGQEDTFHTRYIADRNGMIISSGDSSAIGEMSGYKEEQLQKVGDSVIRATLNGEEIQTVFSSVEVTDWIIIDEVPVSWLMKDVDVLKRYQMIILIVSLFVAIGLSQFWIFHITAPLMRLTGKMKEMEEGKLGGMLEEKTVRELGVVGRQFNRMSEGIVSLMDKNRHMEEEKRYLEIETLRQQINPHFIYNTLNTIKWMAILSKNDNITVCVEAFGNLLRPIFRHGQEECTLGEELRYASDYITIMNFRYGNQLKLIISSEKENETYKVPRLILQPFLENSILHGMKGEGTVLQITVEVRIGENMEIYIMDNGRGMREEKLETLQKSMEDEREILIEEKEKIGGTGIGVSNVCRRIRLIYGLGYGVQIRSRYGEGTEVIIKIPLRSA